MNRLTENRDNRYDRVAKIQSAPQPEKKEYRSVPLNLNPSRDDLAAYVADECNKQAGDGYIFDKVVYIDVTVTIFIFRKK